MCAASSPELQSSDLKGLVHRSVNPFAFSMFGKMQMPTDQENVVISPVSIYVCLSMLAPGLPADSVALQELHSVLQCQESCNTVGLPTAFPQLLQFFTASIPDSGVALTLANSAWFESAIESHAEVERFARLLEEHVGAEAQRITTLKALNDWCAANTGGLIKHMLDSLPERFALINALYFRGAWSTKFDAKDTEVGAKFWTTPSKSVACAMMSRTDKFRYLDCKEVQMVSLPYGKAKRFEMQIILPKSMPLDQFVASPAWSLENWSTWAHDQRMQRGRVRIPRLDIAFGAVSLRNAIESMGLAEVFRSFLTPTTKVDDVFHKTMLRVDEEGTVAAAVTVVASRGRGAPAASSPFDFCADRPFLMLIREEQTNAILFISQIWSPS